jgi:hypothetical protein
MPEEGSPLSKRPSSFSPPTASSWPRLSVYELLPTDAFSVRLVYLMPLACQVCDGCFEGPQWPDLIDLVRLPIPR